MPEKTKKRDLNAILLIILVLSPFLVYMGMRVESGVLSTIALALFIGATIVMLIHR